jgi:hypothetical protein
VTKPHTAKAIMPSATHNNQSISVHQTFPIFIF